MADSGQEVNGDAVHYDEEQGEYGDERDGQEQEAGSQTTEEEIPPREATPPPPPSAYPQGGLPPAPEVPPPLTSGASTSGGGRPKPQYQLKYTMAGAMPQMLYRFLSLS
jgi:COMPASS component SWD3